MAGNVQLCPEGERRSRRARCGPWGVGSPLLPDVEIRGCFMQLLPGRHRPSDARAVAGITQKTSGDGLRLFLGWTNDPYESLPAWDILWLYDSVLSQRAAQWGRQCHSGERRPRGRISVSAVIVSLTLAWGWAKVWLMDVHWSQLWGWVEENLLCHHAWHVFLQLVPKITSHSALAAVHEHCLSLRHTLL